MNIFVTTSRYNNETWDEYVDYKKRKQLACIYAPPFKITKSIDINSHVFVIEMNNSINQIMGIGLIKNKIVTDKVYRVYNDTNLNRYIYIGKYHITREMLLEQNPRLVHLLDEMLFKGYTHSKRGGGLTKIPEKVLKLDKYKEINIKKNIRDLFIARFCCTNQKANATN